MAMLHFFSPGQSMQMEVWQVNIAALTRQAIATRLLAVKAPGVWVRRARQAPLSLSHQMAAFSKPTVKGKAPEYPSCSDLFLCNDCLLVC